jgi:hypothetical protein
VERGVSEKTDEVPALVSFPFFFSSTHTGVLSWYTVLALLVLLLFDLGIRYRCGRLCLVLLFRRPCGRYPLGYEDKMDGVWDNWVGLVIGIGSLPIFS